MRADNSFMNIVSHQMYGDSLWKVAKKYYTTIESLAKVNELEEDSGLNIGDKLIIPGRAII